MRRVAEPYAPREARHHVDQALDRVHLGELAAAEHGVGDGSALGAGITTRE